MEIVLCGDEEPDGGSGDRAECGVAAADGDTSHNAIQPNTY